ncbi:MAG: hypothetical protein VKJ46_11910 [Leptolyngbyaceae bacterium]|nr:hypothetical protein [Leptolyngbyaceae bacterium]
MYQILLALAAVGVMTSSIFAAYTQTSALQLRTEHQSLHWPRHGTRMSGRYSGGRRAWEPLPIRNGYQTFQGGGPGSGK